MKASIVCPYIYIYIFIFIYIYLFIYAGPSGRAVEIVGSNHTEGMDILSVVNVVCCQVEVSATS